MAEDSRGAPLLALGDGADDETSSSALVLSLQPIGGEEQLAIEVRRPEPEPELIGFPPGQAQQPDLRDAGPPVAEPMSRDFLNPKWSTVEDLKASWVLQALQVFHAWSFLLSLVVIAGFSCNTFLNLFVDFNQHNVIDPQMHDPQIWVVILALCTKSLLLALFCTGMLQRGVWLFQDSIRLDMFKAYRRTLCCEGPGPGNFPMDKRVALIRNDSDRQSVHRALGQFCVLREAVRIDRKRFPAGSQLLALEAMSGRASADDVLDLALPAKLVFQVDERPTGFRDQSCCGVARATADIVFQVLIFASIDGVPIAVAAARLTFTGVIALEWVNDLMRTAVLMCTIHIFIYYGWSTLLDYVWKVSTLWSMCKRHGLNCFGRQLIEGELAAASQATVVAAPNTQAFHAAAEALVVHQAEATLGVVVSPTTGSSSRSSAEKADDFLNVCVCTRNCLVVRWVQWTLLGMGLALLIVDIVLIAKGTASLHQSFVIGTGVLGLLLVVVFLRYFCCSRGRQKVARQFADMISAERSSGGLWALWFRVNCSFDPMGVFLRQVILLAAAIAIMSVGISAGLWVLTLVSCMVAGWSVLVIVMSLFAFHHLWKFLFAQSCLLAFVAILAAALTRSDNGMMLTGAGGIAILVVVTQVGMSRHGAAQSHCVFLSIFSIYITMIAAVAFVTASSTTGTDWGEMIPEWCDGTEKTGGESCIEYDFPLNGTRKNYGFCGMSWPMGANGTDIVRRRLPGTVSARCSDTQLTVTDFAHFARVPYFLPNYTRLLLSMEKHLPGWDVVYTQHYDVSLGTKNTFAHVKRGTTSVVTIRGTSSAAEVLQDANFWMPASFLQFAQVLGPSLFSVRSILTVITGNYTQFRTTQLEDILHYIEGLMVNSSETVYVTGHSLGGGLADAMAGILGIPAVTFSAPGIGDTSAILEPMPSLKELRHAGVNIMPKGDLVPLIDSQSGAAVPLDCPFPAGMACHSLQPTLCEILAACGDGGGRDVPRGYSRSCTACAHSGQSYDNPTWECPAEEL